MPEHVARECDVNDVYVLLRMPETCGKPIILSHVTGKYKIVIIV
jgi:hypothetical protein